MTLSDTQEDSDPQFGRSTSDVFKILIATDIHLGYGEKDPNIGKIFLARF